MKSFKINETRFYPVSIFCSLFRCDDGCYESVAELDVIGGIFGLEQQSNASMIEQIEVGGNGRYADVIDAPADDDEP